MVKHCNAAEFEEILRAETRPVVVDFWATWCGPCKMLAPVYEAVAEEIGERALFLKIDVDENMDLAQEYGITSIPNVLLLRDGEVKDNSLGFVSKSELKAFVERNL